MTTRCRAGSRVRALVLLGALSASSGTAAEPQPPRANADCVAPRLSALGNVVAFHSNASSLVAADGNGMSDVFVRDLATGETTRVSVGSDGREADGNSTFAAVSADGRYVAFASEATNLVEGDTNGATDVFVRDRREGVTLRVSVGSRGGQADGPSRDAAISADGRFIAFSSTASNLVAGDANGAADVFVHDRRSGRTTLVSLASSGGPADAGSLAPAISSDGRRVAFLSHATNLGPGAGPGPCVFVRDLRGRRTMLASVSTDGVRANAACERPALSGDGRRVAFASWATNLATGDDDDQSDVFLRDIESGTTRLVSAAVPGPGIAHSRQPAISSNGSVVAFERLTTTAGAAIGDAVIEVFVADVRRGPIQRVSVDREGNPADRDSAEVSTCADGSHVAFASKSSKLVTGDANRFVDVFVRDLSAGTTLLASLPNAVRVDQPAGGEPPAVRAKRKPLPR